MNPDPLRLDALLASVADGADVDWEAAEAAADDRQRRLVRNLRVVANIAQVHRTVPVEDASTGSRSPLDALSSPENLLRWGHLLLLQKIGEGTFGEVYRASDPWLDRQVALKLLKPGIAAPGRLIDEARALARVRHPNVVTVHGADMHQGRVGLWMELVRGRTLAQIVETEGPFSAAEAALIGQELCKAVAAVHAVGLVHRDIKAQNVMRESGGRVVLMDFGAGHTPLYLAPELMDGSEPTVASDIYAMGALLYYLVTARYPVTGTSYAELKQAHGRGERRRLAEARPDLPETFLNAVERALDPDPRNRFETAWQMQQALVHAPLPVSTHQPLIRRTLLAIAGAVLVTGITLAVLAVLGRLTSAPVHASIQTVAVLPLQDVTGKEPHVAAGLTESLTQELSMSGALRVASRTSVERLVADRTPLSAIGSALDADAVIEGSVTRTDDGISVNVRLIHAATGGALWARTFDRQAANAVMVEREIARAIADEFRLAVTSNVLARWDSKPQINPAAYDEYMRGRYEYRRQSQPGVEGAVMHFERAIAIEPRYARAHTSLAQCYVLLGAFGVLPRADAARRARAAGERALQIDDAMPEAHVALGTVDFEAWNFAEAEKRFERAIGLDPSFVEPRVTYALFLASRGRFEEAFAHLATARNVDPLSADVADRTAAVYYYARRYPEALTELQRAIRLDPDNVGTKLGLVRTLTAVGRYKEAIAEAERAAAQGSNHPWFQAEIAQAEIGAGRTANAKRRIATLLTPAGEPSPRVAPYTLAVALARLDRNQAFKWLQREFDMRSGAVLWVKVDPRLEPLRADPRWPGLLKRLQLEP